MGSGVSSATITTVQQVQPPVWPGIQPSAGKPLLARGGFRLPPNKAYSLKLPPLWSGRFWGRHGCIFDASGRGHCATGDCGGAFHCNGLGGTPPATLAEITLGNDQDFYDVSLVDGYNIAMSITPYRGSGKCSYAGYCCTGSFGSPQSCKPTAYSRIFKAACPKAYSYAYDDPTSIALHSWELFGRAANVARFSCVSAFGLGIGLIDSPNHYTKTKIKNNHLHYQSSYWTRKIHNLCTQCRQVDEALALLDHLRLRGYRPDSLNLSSIIHALCDANRFDEAHHRFVLFISSHCVPDERTCNVLIARLLDSQSPHLTLHALHRLFDVKPEFVPSVINYNRLIYQYCEVSLPNVAHRLLFDMISRGHSSNIVTYTTLIGGYCRVSAVDAAYMMFDEMREHGVVPNSLTYSVLIRGVLRQRDVEHGKELMCDLWETMTDEEDHSVNSAAFSNIIDSLCREGFFNEVFKIAEDMPQGKSVNEEFAYGHMIDSLCRAGRNHGASRIVYIMRKRGFTPSLVS
ncbi:hypothetical protein GH714_022591 [Hevea brasiliensis]|uniref:Uncharacterized protein n=1 Tax=Hevea brasiliensis TaxID=3981 RepID=A0A6A6MUK8_HEVBR|nr:hypothetical protein GH714_022591 [Hevea brasiliensis]